MSANLESGRINQILTNAQRCAVQSAILQARASGCCPPSRVSTQEVPQQSSYLAGKTGCYAFIPAVQATTTESTRILRLQQEVIDAAPRFSEYQGPRVQVQCPPLPTEITNAFLPKPSTRCDTLAILATGSVL
jgi:hypothetical protein